MTVFSAGWRVTAAGQLTCNYLAGQVHARVVINISSTIEAQGVVSFFHLVDLDCSSFNLKTKYVIF